MDSIADAVKSVNVRLSKTTRSALIVLLIAIPDWINTD
jgi:hypothetical protein